MAQIDSNSSVVLTNTAAPILVNITIPGITHHSNNSSVRISSSGPINASISLLDTTTQHWPMLDLAAQSNSSDPLSVRIISAPLDSLIFAQAESSAGYARLWLPPSFEGNFSLHSRIRHFELSPYHEDPSGRGRQRKISHQWTENGIEGWTLWKGSDETRDMGSARVVGASVSLLF
jgi:hypothetical protein